MHVHAHSYMCTYMGVFIHSTHIYEEIGTAPSTGVTGQYKTKSCSC